VKDADEGVKTVLPDANTPKPTKLVEEVKEAPVDKRDFSLLDSLVNQFIETDDEKMLPVLCGYFYKIFGSLLTKEKQTTLEYLLLKREGVIFDGLLKHIRHHSLALLVIDLLQIQIKPETTRIIKGERMAMYNSDGSDAENHEDDAENEGMLSA
jgi:hypothetical protein